MTKFRKIVPEIWHDTYLQLWQKMIFSITKMAKNQPNSNLSKFWNHRQHCQVNKIQSDDFWYMTCHILSITKNKISNMKMAKNQPNSTFSTFLKHHSQILDCHYVTFDEIRPGDFWGIMWHTFTIIFKKYIFNHKNG